MRIVAADWLPYALPLKRPWQTSRGCLNERHGKLLRLQSDDGRVGWGDSAPWPSFGIDETRAVAFAEETATLDLAAQSAGLALDAWLSGGPPAASLAVNANIGALPAVDEPALERALEDGYSLVKIKVGTQDWQEDIKHLQRLARRLPDRCQFRLDANAAWTSADARAFLQGCRELPIEGLEEPLQQPTLAALAGLQALVPFPLAIDESHHLIDREFFERPPLRRLIIKPARHGGLLASLAIALRARTAGIECVVTSCLESTCGMLACAHLAAVIGPQSTHGLGTAEWLCEDTGSPLPVSNGRLYLPGSPGLGFIPAFATDRD